jgi:hypothetical protein
MLERTLFALVAVTGVIASAQAQVLYDTGFERPAFNPGNISGQGTWSTLSARFDVTPSVAGVDPFEGAQMVSAAPSIANAYAYPWLAPAWNNRLPGNNVVHS